MKKKFFRIELKLYKLKNIIKKIRHPDSLGEGGGAKIRKADPNIRDSDCKRKGGDIEI